MIDLNLLREQPERIIGLLKRKDPTFDAQKLYDWDIQLRKLRLEVEELRHKKNELAKQGKSGITEELRAQSVEVYESVGPSRLGVTSTAFFHY